MAENNPSCRGWKTNAGLFLGGQALSLFGSMLVQYAILWHITLTSQSGSAMTLYVVTSLLPIFFISPFGGVWADRFNRKLLINLADGGIALVTLAAALVFLAGYRELWLFFTCAAVRALGQGVHSPAITAFIPQITPAEHLSKVNGINTSIQSLAMIVAPMASGALLTFVRVEVLFFVDVITAATGIAIVYFFVQTPIRVRQERTGDGMGYFRDLREGFRYIGRQGFIKQLIFLSVFFHIMISPCAFLTPLQTTRNFGADVWRLTAIETAFSAGMLLGGLAIGFWGGFRNKVYSMSLSCGLMGISTVALGLLGDFWIYTAVMLFLGILLPLYSTPSTVLLQTQVNPDYHGRVFSVFGMTYSFMMPAGMLFFGPLSDVVNINVLMVSSGIIISLLGIPFLASRAIRTAGRG